MNEAVHQYKVDDLVVFGPPGGVKVIGKLREKNGELIRIVQWQEHPVHPRTQIWLVHEDYILGRIADPRAVLFPPLNSPKINAAKQNARRFCVGGVVAFIHTRVQRMGVIIRVNRKTCSVDVFGDSRGTWRVPPNLLWPVIRP